MNEFQQIKVNIKTVTNWRKNSNNEWWSNNIKALTQKINNQNNEETANRI